MMKNDKPKNEETENEKDDFWEDGYFAETMSSDGMKQKMRTFHMKHDEEMNFTCRKCSKKKISAHNKDWHAGLCDECFNACFHPDAKR